VDIHLLFAHRERIGLAKIALDTRGALGTLRGAQKRPGLNEPRPRAQRLPDSDQSCRRTLQIKYIGEGVPTIITLSQRPDSRSFRLASSSGRTGLTQAISPRCVV
jgi:hypothetical protein